MSAVPVVAASVQRLLEDSGAAGASACAESLTFLTAGCLVSVPIQYERCQSSGRDVQQQLLQACAPAAGFCIQATNIPRIFPMLQGLTTASFSSLAWFDTAGSIAFKDANNRLRSAVKDALVPALAACLQSAAGATAGVAWEPANPISTMSRSWLAWSYVLL